MSACGWLAGGGRVQMRVISTLEGAATGSPTSNLAEESLDLQNGGIVKSKVILLVLAIAEKLDLPS